MRYYGLTIPLYGATLQEHHDIFREMVDLGYTDAWSSESDAADAFTPLALAAAWAPELRLCSAVVPVQTRGPGVLAQQLASLAEAAPGRVAIGLGTSSPIVVTNFNDQLYERPYQRARDTLRFLRRALAGEKVTEQFETFSVTGFKLRRPLAEPPKLLLAAGREAMLRLAGREADGAIVNWVAPCDIATVAPVVHTAGDGTPKEIAARIFVCPSTDADLVRESVRGMLVVYLTVPGYRAFHEWVGRGERLKSVFEAWDRGDRAAAALAIPDEVIDEIIVHGTPEACREQIQRYFDNGLTTAILALLPFGIDERRAMRELAPAATA